MGSCRERRVFIRGRQTVAVRLKAPPSLFRAPGFFFFLFPVWCLGARQGPEVRSSQHNASKTCRDTHFFLSLLFVGCSPSVWPLVVLLFVCSPLNYISRIRLCWVQSRGPCILRCLFFFRLCIRISVSSPFRAGGVPLSPFPSLSGLPRLLLRNRVRRFLPAARKARAAARTGPLSTTTIA